MKILILASYAPSLVNFRGPLIRMLVDEGHSVIAVAPDISDEIRAKIFSLGAVPHQLGLRRNGLNPFRDLIFCLQIYRLIRAQGTDLLFTYTIKPNIWGAFAAALARVPSIGLVTGLGAAFTAVNATRSPKQRIAFTFARKLYRWSSNLNTRLIFQNPDDLQDFLDAECLKDESKAALVDGSGVDLEYFALAPSAREAVFVMVARLLGNKGVREYAAAARALRARYPNAKFRLVGPADPGIDGIDPAELDAWIDEGIIDYVGPVADIRPHLADAMVYVLPSYREGTPRSVLEAMSMGRAVVTTDAPGCRETIRDGIEGYIVPVADGEALAAAMERFLRDSELASMMGAKAHERARTKYDVRRINRVMIELLTGSPPQRQEGRLPSG